MASRADEKQRAREARLAVERAEQQSAKRRTAVLRLGLVVALAVVVVVVAIVASSGGSSSNAGGTSARSGDAGAANALFKGIPQQGITLGGAKGKPTLVEFADLQCPFCAEYSKQALPTVVKNYVKTGRIRYELRLRSFLGKDSETAAAGAAAAAKENKLYQFTDLFYQRQGEENSGYVTDDFLRSVASASGANPTAVVNAAHDPASQPLVAQAEQEASSLGSNSTPDFYLRLAGGRLVKVSPQDLTPSAFTQALDQALSQK